MVKCHRIHALGSLLAVATLTLGNVAQAAQFDFKGSDTLYDVLTDAVTKYKTELGLGGTGTDFVNYLGTGSGNAEKAMATHNSANTPWQRIGPMSRNLTAAAQTTCNTRVGAGLCNPELKNVLGLDAAVVVVGSGGFTSCPNLNLGTDSVKPGFAPVDNDLGLILAGKGGTGDWVACSAPERVQAIDRLLACNSGLGQFAHLYRRDDSSGTSDSVREKTQIQRYCNGSHKPAAGTLSANLVGPDNDPIRTSCPAAVPGSTKPVRCTVTDPTSANYLKDCSSKRCNLGGSIAGVTYAAGFVACNADADCTISGVNLGTCTAGLGPTTAGCTAGFVVSLSEPDNTAVTDITLTIAQRILSDSSSFGYAGREAIRKAPVSGSPAKGATINTNQSSDSNIRQDKYMMARRLFLHDTCNQNGGVDVTDSTGVNGRDAAECQFFQWATDEIPLVSAKAGRENIDPILRKFGFLPCQDDFGQPTGDGNLCSKNFSAGFPAGADAPAVCTANNRDATGLGWVATACTAGNVCCSDGLLCENAAHTTNTCPVPPKRPVGAACLFNADCASNNCDGFATATTGACAP